MPQVHNKENKTANVEAIALVNVDVSAADYSSRSNYEHFGLILPEAATLKVKTLDGTIGTFALPAGYNPIACLMVYTNGSNTITEFVAYY